jgi:hypothetical protein
MNWHEQIASTLKMEAIRSSEMSANKMLTWRHIPEDGILHSHRRENLKSHNMDFVIEFLEAPQAEIGVTLYKIT